MPCTLTLLLPIQKMAKKNLKNDQTLANGYPSERTRRELSNEYQHDRVSMIFKNLCVIMLWMKVASALKGLNTFLHLLHYNYHLSCQSLTFTITALTAAQLWFQEWGVTWTTEGEITLSPISSLLSYIVYRHFFFQLSFIVTFSAISKLSYDRSVVVCCRKPEHGLSQYLETGCPNRGSIDYCMSKVWYKVHTTN